MNKKVQSNSYVKLFDTYESHSIIDTQADKKIMIPVICSHPGCEVTGMAYVDPKSKKDKPHFCIEHNPMIERN